MWERIVLTVAWLAAALPWALLGLALVAAVNR